MSYKGNRQTPSGYAAIRWAVNILENVAIEGYSGRVENYRAILDVLHEAARDLAEIREGRPARTLTRAASPAATPAHAAVPYGGPTMTTTTTGSDCPWRTCEPDGSCRPVCEIIIKVS